ncbi:MAG: hypothetical protein KAT68_14815 [Bacteroidales bacterium]|nr:hypothetical protein [Bacteroidales bacterium]
MKSGIYTQIYIQLIFSNNNTLYHNQTPMEFRNALKILYYNNPSPMDLSFDMSYPKKIK